jgi:hypothetical protein
MNSYAPLPVNRVDHAPSDALDACVQPMAMELHGAATEFMVQNGRRDSKPRIELMHAADPGSPLIVLAIGTACLFAAMAAVMAFG